MPTRPLSRHLADLVRETAQRAPGHPAVVAGGAIVSYAGLDEMLDRFARALSSLGVRRGSTVGLLCTNRVEWLAVALAAMRLGARLAAFNTFARAWDLEYMLAHSRTEVLVVIGRFRSRDYVETLREVLPDVDRPEWRSERFPALRHIVVLGESDVPAGVPHLDAVLAAAPKGRCAEHTSAVDDAFVLYTSGSSARPKAVPLQHYGVIENGFSIGERMALQPDDRVWVAVPLFWAYGAVNALPAALTCGATLVLQEAFEPAEALDLIERHACTAAYTLPNITSALLGDPSFHRQRTASLRTGLTIGSESDVRRAAEELAAPQICNIYGGTETYGNCCVTPAAWPLERRLVSQGPPLAGVELRIVDDEGADVAPGEDGEILVRGYVTRGYLDAEAGVGAAFTADGWYRTGDLGRLDDDGSLRFAARATEMIKTGGINVAPREVEEYVAMHPGVAKVAVIGVADEVAGEVPVAFVVPRADVALDASELRSHCERGIARYKVPARFHVIDELPETDTGKLARRKLAELHEQAVGRS